jgi:hypothetical protein
MSIYKTNDSSKKFFSYKIEPCKFCLPFNYFNQIGENNPAVNCTLNIPELGFSTSDMNDDKYRADKVLNFNGYNIFLKDGKMFFAVHDGAAFTKIYTDISEIAESLFMLKGKIFIDVLSLHRQVADPSTVYILCHNVYDLIVFSITRDDSTKRYTFASKYTYDKTAINLKYNQISSFWLRADQNELIIAYKHEEIAIAIITKDGTEKRKILEGTTPLDIHDSRFTGIGTRQDLYFIVNGKGFYLYNVPNDKIEKSFAHPFLTQFNMLSVSSISDEYIGVYVDQQQKDINEVLIEFLYSPGRNCYLEINKIYKTDKLKFEYDLFATDDIYYYLYSNEQLYLLPAGQPNSIQTMGTTFARKITNTSGFYMMSYNEGTYFVVTDEQTGKGNFARLFAKMSKTLQCKFNDADKYTVGLQVFTEVSPTGLKLEEFNYNFTVGGDFNLLMIILIAGGIAVLIGIGIGIGCYIRKRNVANQNTNAQLL